MTTKKQIWECNICGNIIEILHEGADALVCCKQPMNLQKENTVDVSQEKHIPIIEGKNIKIGTIEHPMAKEHHIEWVEAIGIDGESCKIFLKPEDKPETEFNFEPASARAYCNLHGLWKSK